MHPIDQQLQNAIDFDDYLEEKKSCSKLTKQETQSASRKRRVAASEPGQLSSKIEQQLQQSPTGFISTSKPHQTINSELRSKKSLSCENSRTEKTRTDPCGRCGCQRQYHNPPKSETYAKTGASSGNAHQVKILARTCCATCPYCICFCVGFVEPFEGQPYQCCVYEV